MDSVAPINLSEHGKEPTGLQAISSVNSAHFAFAQKEVGTQFDSLLVDMLLKTMGTDKAGLAVQNSDVQSILAHVSTPEEIDNVVITKSPLAASIEDNKPLPHFESSNEFVTALWAAAKDAAAILGIDPKFLLAQAALETNWGKSILKVATGASTHNLFNIKTGNSWQGAFTRINAIEYEQGEIIKSQSAFRAYDSFKDSFTDYVQFLQSNSRYAEALKHTAEPAQFAKQLQNANYATDPRYADKIMQIYTSQRLNDPALARVLV